jgi:hypothetical protein
MGVWSLWFVALIALTSVWYLVEQWGGAAPSLPSVDPIAAGNDTRSRTEVVPVDAVMLDRIVASAGEQWPGLRIESIWPPARPGNALVLQGQAEAWLVRERANAMAFDALSGELRGIRRGEALALHQRIAEMADPLHFGTWGGLPSRILWFLAGGLMTALAATGVWLYGLRVVGKVPTPRLILLAAWRGFGRWKWLWLALLAIWLILLPLEAGR